MRWLKFGRWHACLAIELGVVTSLVVAVLGVDRSTAISSQAAAYTIQACYIEACSCTGPCSHDLFGAANTCKKIGALQILSGAYQAGDLSGAQIVFAAVPGQGVKVYVDGRDRDQKALAAAFASELLKEYGEIKKVQEAKIEFFGKSGDFLITVNDGQILQLETEPVIGGDERTPISYGNTRNRISPALYQGRVRKGIYGDGDGAFRLEGTNVFFNENVMSSGRL